MAASPSISILTLYDTPLSLKPNYRHHLVNSLWSLKCLDNCVISDEEIIEDSSFGGRFAPLQPSFYINSSCSLTKVSVVMLYDLSLQLDSMLFYFVTKVKSKTHGDMEILVLNLRPCSKTDSITCTVKIVTKVSYNIYYVVPENIHTPSTEGFFFSTPPLWKF